MAVGSAAEGSAAEGSAEGSAAEGSAAGCTRSANQLCTPRANHIARCKDIPWGRRIGRAGWVRDGDAMQLVVISFDDVHHSSVR